MQSFIRPAVVFFCFVFLFSKFYYLILNFWIQVFNLFFSILIIKKMWHSRSTWVDLMTTFPQKFCSKNVNVHGAVRVHCVSNSQQTSQINYKNLFIHIWVIMRITSYTFKQLHQCRRIIHSQLVSFLIGTLLKGIF